MISSCLTIFVFQLSLIYCLLLSQNIEPAVKVSISREGISQIVLTSKKIALLELPKLNFPVLTVDTDTAFGFMHFQAWNIKIENILSLDYDVSLASTDTLVVTVSDISVVISGLWECEFSNLFHTTDRGTLRLGANRLRMDLAFILGADSRGMPTFNVKSCSGQFNDLWLEIHSKYSWIINLFRKKILKQVNKPCDILRDKILNEIVTKLSKYNPEIFVGHNLVLDVRLLTPPMVEGQIMKLNQKGEFFYENDTSEAPFQPSGVPEINPSKMVNIAVSKFVFNTLSFVSYEHGLLEGTITRNDLPPTFSDLFNTTCSRFLCIGFFVPQLRYLYPNSFVELHYNSTNFPQLQINKFGVNSTIENIYSFRIRQKDNSSQMSELFSLSVNMTLNMVLSIEKDSPILHWKITNFNMIASLLDSKIGWIPDKAGAMVIEWILRLIAIPKIDKKGTLGMKIQLPKHLNLYNLKLHFDNDYVSAQSDFEYIG